MRSRTKNMQKCTFLWILETTLISTLQFSMQSTVERCSGRVENHFYRTGNLSYCYINTWIAVDDAIFEVNKKKIRSWWFHNTLHMSRVKQGNWIDPQVQDKLDRLHRFTLTHFWLNLGGNATKLSCIFFNHTNKNVSFSNAKTNSYF